MLRTKYNGYGCNAETFLKKRMKGHFSFFSDIEEFCFTFLFIKMIYFQEDIDFEIENLKK